MSGRGLGKEAARWGVAALFVLPLLSLYLADIVTTPAGLTPTGFLQYDTPYYIANAREHLDRGGFALTYGNPSTADYTTPAIYVQPMSLLLALVLAITGADPGLVWVLFGATAGVCFMRVAIALFEELFGLNGFARRATLFAFVWGGGVFWLVGVAAGLRSGVFDLSRGDPAIGWWFLNLGRNIALPNEAFQHIIFFAAILATVRGKYRAALGFAAVMSISHPFTGVELALILGCWSLLERAWLSNLAVPWFFPAGLVAIGAFHGAYYLVFLNLFADHRSLFEQWRLPLLYQADTFLAALALVGMLALVALRRLELCRDVLAEQRNRLFAVGFLVAFALANHEFAFKPIQPIHFTRGYDWVPLFLLGAPVLIALFERITSWPRWGAVAASGAILALAVADNAIWFARPWFTSGPEGAFTLSPGERRLLAWLDRPENARTDILADPELAYLATAYTPLRGWSTHPFNTPQVELRNRELARFATTGQLPPGSETTTFLAIDDPARSVRFIARPVGRASRVVYREGGIVVVRIAPAAPAVLPDRD